MTTSSTPQSEYAMRAGARTAEENLLLSNSGPAAYAERADHPDLTVHGEPKIVPMRVAKNFYVEPRDPDPRGMTVVGADGVAGAERSVLVPMNVCKVDGRRGTVRVNAILGSQFGAVPTTASDERVTLLEEDRIMAYFAGGFMFATPRRARPLL